MQETHYYPFGMAFDGAWYNDATASKNKYLYNGKELNEDFGLNLSDYGARWYDASIGRWWSVDPSAEKYVSMNPYTYVYNRPTIAIDPDGKDGILIVFPDYKIDAFGVKWSNLGHAGVLLIDNKTGATKYYEYGRYDKENKGLVRKVSVPNVKIGKDGRPTKESLDKTLATISKKSGHGTRIEGAYVESDKFSEMDKYAQGKMAKNSDADREPYSITGNNCGTFACDVLEQDEEVAKNAPSIADPRPNSIIGEYQASYQKVSYDPKKPEAGPGKTNSTVDKKYYKMVLDEMKKYIK